MNRRKFIRCLPLAFTPLVGIDFLFLKENRLLKKVRNAFKAPSRNATNYTKEWIKTLPCYANDHEYASHLLEAIRQDYISNNVIIVEGIVVSKNEYMLNLAGDLYA
jgi:hypothetical protein